jgi:flavin reductase (DIM6/NTAB) family NADH-FMN oxidoreductase RutF
MVDAAHFRTVLGHFASGVVIVTGAGDGKPYGFTCQSFFSVSLDPPLVAIAPSKASVSWPHVQATGHFCVNLLCVDQEELARTFAVSGGNKFTGVAWHKSESRSPILDDVLAFVDCRIESVQDAGDHFLAVASVLALEISREGGHPLVFYRGGFTNVEL